MSLISKLKRFFGKSVTAFSGLSGLLLGKNRTEIQWLVHDSNALRPYAMENGIPRCRSVGPGEIKLFDL